MANHCSICGKPSGNYALCLDCFALLQQGYVKKCNICGDYYKNGEVCKCVKIKDHEQQINTINNDKNNEDNTPPLPQEEKKFGCLKFFLIFTLIFLILPLGIWRTATIIKNPDRYGETNYFTSLISMAPHFQFRHGGSLAELDLIIISIYAMSDYEELIMEIDFYNEDEYIFKQDFVTVKNLKNGEQYEIQYSIADNLTLREISQIHDIDLKVYKYTI